MSVEETPLAIEDVRVDSIDKSAELIVYRDVDDNSKIVIVPMDDCMIEIMYSNEYKCLVGVVREIPCGD